ncbi:MAG: hypothetical protein NTX57_18510 [Armatimonadetes bacterium]|nr:hypothetical protein [Armatimonadota bacterium]
MGSAILERRTRITAEGNLLLNLPEALRGQEVTVQVRSSLPTTETELIAEINRPLSLAIRTRYEAMMEKRRAETLSPSEYDELQSLTDTVEGDHLRRWENLAKLASLRGENALEAAARFSLLPKN